MMDRIKWSLVKLPDDLGVFHVGGKTGARLGPESFQNCFNKFRGKFDASAGLEKIFCFETTTGNIREHLDSAANLVKSAQLTSPFTLVIGGGHDFGYAQIRGVYEAKRSKIGCINLDAHFDLRKPDPEITSGSPFYLLIEEKIISGENLIEFGIQTHCNGPELWEYAALHQIEIATLNDVRRTDPVERFKKSLEQLSSRVDHIVINLDLDCIEEASAPGVSAPQAEGFTTREIFDMLRIAAKNEKVVSLGIFELNPLFDRNLQTARIAAKAAFTLLETRAGES